DCSALAKVAGLERKLRTKAERRGRLHQQRRSVERIQSCRNSRDATVNRVSLIQSHPALAIKDVEPVTGETDFFLLSNPDWVVDTQMKIHRGRRAVRTDAFDRVREASLSGHHHRNGGRAALNA